MTNTTLSVNVFDASNNLVHTASANMGTVNASGSQVFNLAPFTPTYVSDYHAEFSVTITETDQNTANNTANGRTYQKFTGAKSVCMPCSLRQQCLRKPDTTEVRQVAFFRKNQVSPLKHTESMKQKIDTPEGRALYGRRIATVEPVFGNLRYNKRLDRFTLRGQRKVDTQWKLYCMVHNIEKLAHHGYAG